VKYFLLIIAIVTAQFLLLAVKSQRHVTMGTTGHKPALAAKNKRRVTPAVKK
jgi:hypothetical protein